MFFLGWTLSCLILPRLADTYGRRPLVLIFSWFSVLVYLGLLLSRSLELTIALFFLLGLTCTGKSSTGYVYLMELIGAKWQAWASVYMMLLDSITMIMLAVYFKYITKEWMYFQIFGITLLTLASIAVYWVPESPKLLHSQKKYDLARKSLLIIAKSNRNY